MNLKLEKIQAEKKNEKRREFFSQNFLDIIFNFV